MQIFINKHYQCDGIQDCKDGKDEENCPNLEYYFCNDKQQILTKFVCDRIKNCENGEDEKNCGKTIFYQH